MEPLAGRDERRRVPRTGTRPRLRADGRTPYPRGRGPAPPHSRGMNRRRGGNPLRQRQGHPYPFPGLGRTLQVATSRDRSGGDTRAGLLFPHPRGGAVAFTKEIP